MSETCSTHGRDEKCVRTVDIPLKIEQENVIIPNCGYVFPRCLLSDTFEISVIEYALSVIFFVDGRGCNTDRVISISRSRVLVLFILPVIHIHEEHTSIINGTVLSYIDFRPKTHKERVHLKDLITEGAIFVGVGESETGLMLKWLRIDHSKHRELPKDTASHPRRHLARRRCKIREFRMCFFGFSMLCFYLHL